MEYAILRKDIPYTGKELRSGWVREIAGFGGDAAVGFVGPCRVANEDLVDMDDARAGEYIESARMAHLIVEHMDCPLGTGILRQRLLVCLLSEILLAKGKHVWRDGDDVYYDRRKLTVSIAAPSRRSSLIHVGINVSPEGAPVPAVGLDEMGIDAMTLLSELLQRYQKELRSCAHAEEKVRTVP